MSELRTDLVTGRVVLLAPGRSARPHTNAAPATESASANCPFCPGHEVETPPEVVSSGSGAPDAPGWEIRVVPNLYPIVGGPEPGPGGAGAHEVVIFHADHTRDFGRLDDARVTALFRVLRARARVHGAAGLAHVQVLVNQGRSAGASIAHPHAQVLATEFVPPAVLHTIHRFAAARADVVMADAEAATAQGGGLRDGAAFAWCPWAAASPFETRITTSDAGSHIECTSDAAIDAIACTTRDVVAALRAVLGDVAYNVVVNNAPTESDGPYHWYVTVMPRISTIAGFELGTGVFVNITDPTDAAGLLREAMSEPAR